MFLDCIYDSVMNAVSILILALVAVAVAVAVVLICRGRAKGEKCYGCALRGFCKPR